MMLMRIGVIVEQCSWLSPAGQNLPVIAAAVSACTPVSNQPRFFTTRMIMMLTMMQAGGSDELHQTPLHQRAYFSFWQGFHLFLLFGTQFFAWCFLSILSWILEGFKCDPTKKLRCLDTFFNFWPFLLVGKATSLWQKLHWDSLWMQLFFLKPLQFKRLWVVPSWHEWGTHCAKTG